MTHEQWQTLFHAVRSGAPNVIGYDDRLNSAFRHGWNTKADYIYSALLAIPEFKRYLDRAKREA